MKASKSVPLGARAVQPVMLTRMGFGGAPLGNLYRRIGEVDAQATMQVAFDGGMRYFDTAPQYGLGLSEQRFGVALRRFGREAITLSTKVGRLLEDCGPGEVSKTAFVGTPQRRFIFDYSYDGVMRSHEASLARLQVERVDILLVHDVDVFTHGSQAASDARVRELFDKGGYRALQELKAEGRIRAIGAGVNEWQVCQRLLELGDFDTFLLAGRYTLLEQEALDSFLPLCVARDVGIILGGPYNSGILATGPVEGARYNYAPALPDIMDRVRRIEAVCIAHGVRLIEAALQFVMGHPAIRTVIPGAATAQEVEDNIALFSRDLPTALWSDLKGEGLIRRDAPTPEEA
ncbi:D-threo-aldose 1-dehydrogenase [Pseudaminobacter salicylatoxidans]|uniref:D-threo-aldose 1-dehydrogenase n=1 Tax=Pseudaminobacter salicylatoxidans TaxID=93369 RepID=A0A316C1B2_PSESE|nr:aldo/keto reductase [Pseudaminobacter salicylatoxidans]PWJ82350.1 D-threo-aldose 1-dehydrogenase [Pseudaminobacter salicylatoxidans]